MIISYKYRLYPSKAQVTRLNETLETCRQVYNWILSDREEEYKITKKSPTVFTQQRRIKVFRETWKELQLVYSQVLQNVVVRVDKAYQGFFRRLKKGDKPGYPRYKGRGWYDSFTYPQSGFSLEDKKLKLSKVGSVKIKLHRFPEGIIKTCNIRRHNNKWYACFTCKTESKPLPTTGKSIGIDVGLEKFAALSNGDFIENPRFFRAEEKQLAKAQKRFSKNKTKRTRRVVTHIHERIANKRHNFIHQLSRKIINEYDIIAVEKLNVTNMVKNHNLAKSISDASWTMFDAFRKHWEPDKGMYVSRSNPIMRYA